MWSARLCEVRVRELWFGVYFSDAMLRIIPAPGMRYQSVLSFLSDAWRTGAMCVEVVRNIAFPHRAARESARRGRRCYAQWLPKMSRAVRRFGIASLEGRGGPAGYGRTLCRH